MPKYAAKVDANQKQIVSTLRKAGASVQHLHTVGKGCPDILVGYQGANVLMEIKDGAKPPSARRLTPDEQEWHDGWRGQVVIVHNADEALYAIGVGFVEMRGTIS